MLRTLGKNEAGVPARSPSGSKGDIDDPNQHTYGRGGASPHADKSDLMSPLWSIIDLHMTSQPRRPESWPFLLLTQAKDRKR